MLCLSPETARENFCMNMAGNLAKPECNHRQRLYNTGREVLLAGFFKIGPQNQQTSRVIRISSGIASSHQN